MESELLSAAALGVNAVLGVGLDDETGVGGGMLMVAASGTAVRYEDV